MDTDPEKARDHGRIWIYSLLTIWRTTGQGDLDLIIKCLQAIGDDIPEDIAYYSTLPT